MLHRKSTARNLLKKLMLVLIVCVMLIMSTACSNTASDSASANTPVSTPTPVATVTPTPKPTPTPAPEITVHDEISLRYASGEDYGDLKFQYETYTEPYEQVVFGSGPNVTIIPNGNAITEAIVWSMDDLSRKMDVSFSDDPLLDGTFMITGLETDTVYKIQITVQLDNEVTAHYESYMSLAGYTSYEYFMSTREIAEGGT